MNMGNKKDFLEKTIMIFQNILGKFLDGLLEMLTNPNFFNNWKIKTRLILGFTLLSFLPMIIVGLSIYNMSKNTILTKIDMYSNYILKQASEALNNEVKDIENNLIKVSNDMTLLRIIEDNTSTEAIKKLEIQMLLKNTCIADAAYFDKNMNLFSSSVHLEFDDQVSAIKEKSSLENLKPAWTLLNVNNQSCLVVSKPIPNMYYSDILGYLVFVVYEKDLKAKYEYISLGYNSDIMLVDETGTVITSKSSNFIIGSNLNKLNINYMEEANKDRIINIKNNRYFKITVPFSDRKWVFIGLIPESYVYEEPLRLAFFTISISLACFVLAVILSVRLSNSIAKPLSALVKNMNEAKTGNFNISSLNCEEKSEIGIVTRNFENMVKNIRSLINNVNNSITEVLENSSKVQNISSELSNFSCTIESAIKKVAEGADAQAKDLINCVKSMEKLSGDITKVVQEVEYIESMAIDSRTLGLNSLEKVNNLDEFSEETKNAINQISKSMYDLNRKIKEIGKITRFNKEISEGVKLIAINAAIEASRLDIAKEHGFFVISNELKKLSDKSKKGLKDISLMLKDIKEDSINTFERIEKVEGIVKEQTNVMKEVKEAFTMISDSMKKSVDRITVLDELTNSMLKSKEDTLQLVENISAVSQEFVKTSEKVYSITSANTKIVENLEKLSIYLNDLACELEKNLRVFKV